MGDSYLENLHGDDGTIEQRAVHPVEGVQKGRRIMATFGMDDAGYPPIDSDEFLELQIRSKLELDKLINDYQVIRRTTQGQERMDHATTQDRREMLRTMIARSNKHLDKKGNGLIYWDLSLKYARLAVERFNREDIQRGG
jgi:hypothetical protein